MHNQWYGIEGIEFHVNGPSSEATITFEEVTDNVNHSVEEAMWSQYHEEEGPFPDNENSEAFAAYMRENADQVKGLIRSARQ